MDDQSTAMASPIRTPVASSQRVRSGRSRRTATGSVSSWAIQRRHSARVRLRALTLRPQAGQAADVADGVGGDGALAGCVTEHARQRAAAGLRGRDATADADSGDELVESRHGGFADAEVADAGKDVAVEVVAVEPGGVGRLGAVGDVLSNVDVPAFGEVANPGGGVGGFAGWRGAFGQGGPEGAIGRRAAPSAPLDGAEFAVAVADVSAGGPGAVRQLGVGDRAEGPDRRRWAGHPTAT